MLHCIYSPLHVEPEVIHTRDLEQWLATGVWFKTPNEAKAFKEKALAPPETPAVIEPIKEIAIEPKRKKK